MKSKLFAFFALFAVVALGSVRFVDISDYSKESLALHVNVDNRQNFHSANDVRVKFLIMDTDYYGSSGITTIHGKDVSSKTILADAYDIQPGEYMAKVYVYGDGIRKIRYVPLTVG